MRMGLVPHAPLVDGSQKCRTVNKSLNLRSLPFITKIVSYFSFVKLIYLKKSHSQYEVQLYMKYFLNSIHRYGFCDNEFISQI
jgi:hypothetical protein